MNLRLITAPTEEPVSTETAKLHLRVDGTADDTLVAAYLKAARELGEGLARRAFVTQTLELVIDAWPSNGILKLPRPPLQSVTSIKYLDSDEVEHTLSSANYVVDARSEPGRIMFKSTPSAALSESGAIAVRFVAGYGAASTVPAVFVQGVLLSVAHWYENREAAMPMTLTEIPLGVKPLFMSDRGSWF
jgi:uncharacterized phiE125 gp8 family phage protein